LTPKKKKYISLIKIIIRFFPGKIKNLKKDFFTNLLLQPEKLQVITIFESERKPT